MRGGDQSLVRELLDSVSSNHPVCALTVFIAIDLYPVCLFRGSGEACGGEALAIPGES